MVGKRARKGQKRSRDTHDPHTALPEALREELSDQQNTPQNKTPLVATRKEKRKEKRKDKKRAAHNAKTEWQKRRNGKSTTKAEPEKKAQPIAEKRPKEQGDVKKPKKKRKTSHPSTNSPVAPPKQDIPEIDPDKREIRRLEKLLGIDRKRKRKESKGKSAASLSYASLFGEEDEDLSSLLQICDRSISRQSGSTPIDAELPEEDQSEGDSQRSSDVDEASEGAFIDSRSNEDMQLSSSEHEAPGNLSDGSLNHEDMIDDDVNLEDLGDGSDEDLRESSESESENSDTLEDIQKKSESTNDDSEPEAPSPVEPVRKVPSKYVPPSARMGGTAEMRIKRKIKGLLNRVADANASGIAESILRIFNGGDGDTLPRRDMASVYAKAALDSVRDGSGVGHINPYISSHAAIASHLGSRIDNVVLAELLVSAVRRIVEILNEAGEEAKGEKSALINSSRSDAFGYVALLCSLYERRAISCQVIYDLVKLIAKPLVMERLELLLTILRQAGNLLRMDDPVALKDMIEFIHVRAAEQEKQAEEGRCAPPGMKLQIMLDLISDIKNNKLKRTALKENISKFAWAGSLEQPLNASVNDLLDDDFVAVRWWDQRIGLSIQERRSAHDAGNQNGENNITGFRDKGTGTDLSSLASSLRLNTEFRKALFTVIMSSANVSDAWDRLERMSAFSTKQGHDRDTALVILHCCGSEKSFNPFYALLAERMCLHSRRLRFTFEFALWDVFKQVPGSEKVKPMPARKTNNFAHFLAHVWSGEALSLSVLRFIDNLEECGEHEKSFYVSALKNLFFKLEKIEKQGASAQGPFEKLTKETWDGVEEFQASLALFIRGSVRPELPSNLKKLIKSCTKVLGE